MTPRRRRACDRARPRLLTSAQLAAALLLTTLFTLPFAPDRAGPHAAAAGAKKRVELTKFRTRTSRTYRNGNGTLTTSLYSGSVNYRKRGGGWAAISSDVVPARRGGFAWRNEANAFDTFFRRRIDGEYLRFAIAGVNFGFGIDGAETGATGSANGERVSYRDAIRDVDLRYELFGDGLKETLVLPDADAPTRYRFTMATPARPRVHAEQQRDGSWAVFLGTRTRPLFVLEAPTAVDATGARGGSPALDVVRDGKGFALELSLDERWLRAPERTFPVLLDPTITIQPSSQDASFNAACPTCTPYLDTKLYIGTTASERWRSAVQFNLADVPAGANVTDARLKLYYSGNCVPTADGICRPLSAKLDAHRMTSVWTTTSTSGALAFDPTPVASLNFSTIADADVQWLSWDVTGTVKNWLAGTQTNYGLLLKRETEPLSASGPAPLSRRFTTEVGLQPKLEVTYAGDGVDLLVPDTLHADGAELRWTRFSGPSGAPFEKYEVHRSPTAKFTPSASTLLATIRDQNVTFFRDTTAAPSKAFSYRVVANSSVSNERRVTLPGPGNSNKTLQPAPAEGKATYVDDAGTRCTNHGAESDVWLSAEPAAVRRGLVHFDVRDIPTTATVTGARLSLWRPFHAGVNAWIDAHNVTAAWEEGSGSDACTGDGATWNETAGGVGWTSSGVDYDPTPIRSINSNNAATWNNFYIETLAQRWVSGSTPNLGVLLKMQDETRVGAKKFRYYGDDFSVAPTLRPKLYVAYKDGSQAEGPTVSVATPAPAEQVGGATVTVRAAASDDRRVDKVEFFADGGTTPFATDTSPPFEGVWNSTAVANGAHTLTAKATDDAGNPTTSTATDVTVHNSALPTTSVSSPAAGTTVTGTTTVSANAADDLGVTKVEFYADDLLIGEDTTAPYGASWDTLNQAQPAYDGAHVLTTKAYDTGGQVTTSATRNVTAANTASTKYKAAFSSTEFPQTVIYDPAAVTQEKYGLDVTVNNSSGVAWAASDVVLKYRWYSPDATPVVTNGPDVSLGTDLPAGQSRVVRVMAEPPALPDGVNKAQYGLRVDLYSKANGAWFADKGNKPLENPVIVNKALVRGALGFEPYYQFVGEELGAGMRHEVNVANGNSIVRWSPFSLPGRGLDTLVTLTHNALEKKCDCPAGNNFSLGISSLTRLGNPIDVHPNKADEIAGRANKYIEFTDGDGTTHRFTSTDGITYQEPSGVHLFLRRYSTTDPTRKWAFTTPERVTFLYDSEGYPTFVEDRNGNRLTYALESTPPGEDPGGPKKRITSVTDAGGRALTVTYYSKAEAKKAHVRGKVKRITDHSGRALDFQYYEDGNLRKLIQRGGTNADGSFLADRSFVFTYTTSDGSGPAIPLAPNRADPDPKTPNQSTRLYSVRDPRGAETLFSYLGPGNGEDRWKLATRTDRGSSTTSYAYDIVNRVTTITLPLSRVWKYGYDVDGKVTALTNPLNELTTQAWSGDRMLAKVTEPTEAFRSWTYNDNGYVTSHTNQVGATTQITYQNVAVDANDASAQWRAGRTIPHISQLSSWTDPKAVATGSAAKWQYAYDAKGNLTSMTDPLGAVTRHEYALDGTLAKTTDPNGHATSFAGYDANGLVGSVTDALGRIVRYAFTANGELIWSQDALHASATGGDPRTYRTYFDRDSFGRVGRRSRPKSTAEEPGRLIWTARTYDANDNAVAQTDPTYGGVDGGAVATAPRATSAYDAMDRLTLATSADTTGDPNGARTAYDYDAAGQLVRETGPKGMATPAVANDFTAATTYDALGRVTTITRYPDTGAASGARVENYCYDLAGDLRAVIAPLGNATFTGCPAAQLPYSPTTNAYATKYVYDAAHQLLSTIDALDRTRSVVYDANGRVTSETDEKGDRQILTYDEAGRTTSVTLPFNTSVTPARTITQHFEYDAVGNVLREVSPRAYDTSPDKQTFTQFVTKYVYDAADQLTRIDLPTSTGSPTPSYVHRTYDANGRLATATPAVAAADRTAVPPALITSITRYDTGDVRTLTIPDRPTLYYDYDASGRQTLAAPLGPGGVIDELRARLRTYSPDGLLLREADAGGLINTYQYDAGGNETVADAGEGLASATQTTYHVETSYNGFDEVTKVRLKRDSEADFRFTTAAYDANGNAVAVDRGGIETGAGTIVVAPRSLQYTFDRSDAVTSLVDGGSTTTANDDRKTMITYTPNGWEETQTLAKPDGASGWTPVRKATSSYFADGDLRTRTTTNGAGTVLESETLSYVDGNGAYNNGNPTANSYRLLGPDPDAACRTADCTRTWRYDAQDRLAQIVTAAGGPTSTTTHTLDLRGNIRTRDIDGDVTTYTYSDGDQLVTKTHAGDTTKYHYDVVGNLACTTDAAGTASTCHPPAGAPVSPSLRRDYAHDHLSRLLSARVFGTPGTLTSSRALTYDALARAATETTTGADPSPKKTSITYPDTGDEPAQETQTNETGSVIQTRTYGYEPGGSRATLVRTRGGSTTAYAYGSDSRANVSLLVGDDGAAAATYGYNAYGGADTAVTRGDTNVADPINPYRYGDRRHEPGTGLIDLGARVLEVEDGRFIQRDELDSPGDEVATVLDPHSSNRYALAGGNPIGLADTDGHAVESVGTATSAFAPTTPGYAASPSAPLRCGYFKLRLPVSNSTSDSSYFQSFLDWGNVYPTGCTQRGTMWLTGRMSFQGVNTRRQMVMRLWGSIRWTGKRGVYTILPIEDADISFKCFRRKSRLSVDHCGFEAFDVQNGQQKSFYHRFGRMGKYFWTYDWFWTALGVVGTENARGRFRAPLVETAPYTCGKRVFGNATKPFNRCQFRPNTGWRPIEPYTVGPKGP